ncbi:MAG: uncharacterized protein QOI66_3485 [Myxococcales bacterium]|jgi:predicted enzyme related to lactoylglutathione lyase|nr:uncharacterized protein [Myxococcales bacterium]
MTETAPIVHIEFRSSDFARSAAFYAKVLGWQTQQNASATYMKLDGAEQPSTGWVKSDLSQSAGPLAYLAVDDLSATLGEVKKAGGRVLVPHRPFAGGGEIAVFADPDGNVIGLWARKKEGAAAASPSSSTAAGKPAKAEKSSKPAKAPAAAKPAKAEKSAKPVKAAKR